MHSPMRYDKQDIKREKFFCDFKLPERCPIRAHPGGILLSQEKFTLNPTAGYSGRVFDTEEVKKQPSEARMDGAACLMEGVLAHGRGLE